jgi:hypothetical protein
MPAIPAACRNERREIRLRSGGILRSLDMSFGGVMDIHRTLAHRSGKNKLGERTRAQ